jgi:hypothetical protein
MGPTVCELEGPIPIVNMSKTLMATAPEDTPTAPDWQARSDRIGEMDPRGARRDYRGRRMSRLFGVALALFAPLLAFGCKQKVWKAEFAEVDEGRTLDAEAPFLKVHTTRGDLFVLERWSLDEDSRLIAGEGLHYDDRRRQRGEGEHAVQYDDVALLETNQPKTVVHSGLIVLGVATVGSAVGTIYCAANPKACFGSCPTFFTVDGDTKTIQAEGFSASIARVLEDTDVDAMYTARATSPVFELLMTNEALETHLVRSVHLLAAPRIAEARVHRDGDRYVSAMRLHAPRECTSPRGDCLPDVARHDDLEYRSPADPRDLARREVVELEFPAGAGQRGIVVTARNSLLNTFLFYQALAYLGDTMSDAFVKLEQARDEGRSLRALKRVGRALGDIDIEVRTRGGRWLKIGAFAEVGPIAREVQLVTIPEEITARLPTDRLRVRLRMTAGNWKVDHVALAELGEAVEPLRLAPFEILRNDAPDAEALETLSDPDRHLITYPGDAYVLRFAVPPGDHELFLESTGYYYEWMREGWLPEQDLGAARQMILSPRRMLRRLAPAYKAIEDDIEEIFWNTRVERGEP